MNEFAPTPDKGENKPQRMMAGNWFYDGKMIQLTDNIASIR